MYRPFMQGSGAQKPLLDTLSQAPALAFSFRRLRADYTGNCCRVRRSNDNVELDIGFTAAGVLDQAALAAHVGANSGFLTRWYDQMTAGNARYWEQATAANQPRIVNAGVLDADGVNPGAYAVNTSARMTIGGSPAYAPATVSNVFVMVKAGSTNTNYYYAVSAANNGTSNGERDMRVGRVHFGTMASFITGAAVGDKQLRHGSFPGPGSTLPTQRVNGTLSTSNSIAGAMAAPIGAGFNLFGRSGLNASAASLVFEALVFDAALADADRLAIQRSTGLHYGVTMAA